MVDGEEEKNTPFLLDVLRMVKMKHHRLWQRREGGTRLHLKRMVLYGHGVGMSMANSGTEAQRTATHQFRFQASMSYMLEWIMLKDKKQNAVLSYILLRHRRSRYWSHRHAIGTSIWSRSGVPVASCRYFLYMFDRYDSGGHIGVLLWIFQRLECRTTTSLRASEYGRN